ncbi:MAG: GntR family transcriptional regulator [Firmicutes bacterium]|nr:GntR family transcriptional regulator [Bacillota bacterium]
MELMREVAALTSQRHPVPLYYQLKTLLCQMIDNDELKSGDCIPSERELSEKYEISRMTVRQAITEMVQEGLLIRKQGKGTFVAEPKIEQGLISLSSFTEDMLQRGLHPSTRLLGTRVEQASRRVAKILSLGVDARVMVVERLRLADGLPMALEFSHLPYSRCGDLKPEDLGGSSLYRLLEERLGIQLGKARQTLEPVLADTHEAELLEVEKGSPLLLLERTTLDTLGVPVEFVRSFYRGDRYKFYVELIRQQKGAG